MNQLTPEFLTKSRAIFKDSPGITLQNIRDRLAAEPSSTARRDGLSAFDAIPRLFHTGLADISANPRRLRTLFANQTGARLGVSQKRFANIRSAVIKAVTIYGVPSPKFTGRLQLTATWTALLALVDVPDYCSALRRLAFYCSAMGVEPPDVGQAALLGFYEALVAEEILKDPRAILRNTIGYWNMHAKKVPSWPPKRLSSPFSSTNYIRPLKSFPEPFQRDVANWRRRRLEIDVFDPAAPRKAARSVTVNMQEQSILRFASALVMAGFSQMESITTLGVLVEPEIFKAGLRVFVDRDDGKPTGYVRQYAWLLLSIAKHHCKPAPAVIAALETLVRQLGRNKKGLRPVNKQRLRQFDDPDNHRKLLDYPFAERERGLKQMNPQRRAKYFDRAVAAGILILCCLRMKNLCNFRLDRNIRWSGRKYFITFEDPEMKNDHAHELEVGDELGRLLNEHIEVHRPHLPGASGPYLFAGKNGGPRHHSALRDEFTKGVRKHIGLVVNPHLMRHVMGKLIAERDPALIPQLSQFLGHASLQTTMDYYLENDGLASSRTMNKVLAEFSLPPKPTKKKPK